MYQEECICSRSEVYTTALSGESFSHNWTCPLSTQLESDQFYSFNLSVGFCSHPGIVPYGFWNSNITRFGSKITLTCGKEFVVNGNATMQCVGLSGRSTYFPVWNTSTPSCREAGNETNDDEWEDGNISTKPTQSRQNTSNGHRQTTQILTSFGETTVTSLSREYSNPDTELYEMNFFTYILGTLLGVVFAVIVILSMIMAWWKHQKKRRPEASGQSNVNSSEEQSQLNPLNTSTPGSKDRVVSLHSTSIDTYSAGRVLPQHPGNKFGDIGHRENAYENSAEDHMSSSTDQSRETRQRSGRGSAYTRSCPHDVIHQGGNNDVADNTKALYVDMSGSGNKEKKKVTFLHSKHFDKEEEDVDEDGYLLTNVSLHRVNRVQPEASVSVCGKEISKVSATQSRSVDDNSQSRNCQSSIYHEILTAYDQTAPIPEPQYCPTYWNIEGNDKFGSYAMTQNDPYYAASIYPSTPRVEHEVDEHGYLVLEAHTDENVTDRCESHNSLSSTKTDLYESEISPSTEDHFNSTVYESIPAREPEL
ncbi:uncharacterized protein [Diadema setosum]|uniref:uncharacterized protein n=1 Tax=Diadema setosum TaxID=31175 RepID=UPI003B3B46BC